MEKKFRIVHIHTDYKFIHNVDRFEGKKFDNTIVVIGKKELYNGKYGDLIKYYNYSKSDLWMIITLCKEMDVVVTYGINFTEAYIVNRLPKEVIVLWRFFGKELYERIPEYVYSAKTLEILRKQNYFGFIKESKKQFRMYLVMLRYRTFQKNEIEQAIFNRTDFFLGLSQVEHEFFKSIWNNLPPFVQLNINPYLERNIERRIKRNLIILGNNRSPYNNHIDIITEIKRLKNKNEYRFLLFFNYGRENPYTRIIREESKKVREITILEDFLSLDKFTEQYALADAFVMNGYRQMAMGNIMEALQQNLKIYLNQKNLIFYWLKQSGFIVFTIEDFFEDLKNDNICLSYKDGIVNQERLVALTSQHSVEAFQQSIYDKVKAISLR